MCFACWKPYSTAKCPSAFFPPGASNSPSPPSQDSTISAGQQCDAFTALELLCVQAIVCRQTVHFCVSEAQGWSSFWEMAECATAEPLSDSLCFSASVVIFWILSFFFSLFKKKKKFFFEGLAVWAILKDLEKSHKQELLNNCSVKLKITVCSTTVELLCGRRKLSF